MKRITAYLAALALLLLPSAHCQADAGNSSDPAASGPPGSHCVTGATYCGYILLENQGFDDEAIRAAYCTTPGKCPQNTLIAVEDSLWLSTLYVCLPVGAVPKPKPRSVVRGIRGFGRGDGTSAAGNGRRQIPGVCEDAGPRKLEPLVYCKGEGAVEEVCLNPEGDHIGRCKIPGNVDG